MPKYRKHIRHEHLHISIPKYLMDFIEELAKKHDTTRNYEINICVLLRYLNIGG